MRRRGVDKLFGFIMLSHFARSDVGSCIRLPTSLKPAIRFASRTIDAQKSFIFFTLVVTYADGNCRRR